MKTISTEENIYWFGKELFDMFKKESESSYDDMIVVASLIDKIPNMGGLTRTCQAIGIKGLVVPNLTLVKHEEFKQMSNSSESSFPLYEV